MNEKKVVAVIAEGPSDENAIGGILKEFFSSEEVQFILKAARLINDQKATAIIQHITYILYLKGAKAPFDPNII